MTSRLGRKKRSAARTTYLLAKVVRG